MPLLISVFVFAVVCFKQINNQHQDVFSEVKRSKNALVAGAPPAPQGELPILDGERRREKKRRGGGGNRNGCEGYVGWKEVRGGKGGEKGKGKRGEARREGKGKCVGGRGGEVSDYAASCIRTPRTLWNVEVLGVLIQLAA